MLLSRPSAMPSRPRHATLAALPSHDSHWSPRPILLSRPSAMLSRRRLSLRLMTFFRRGMVTAPTMSPAPTQAPKRTHTPHTLRAR